MPSIVHSKQALIMCRMRPDAFLVVNTMTGELFQIAGVDVFPSGCTNLQVRYGSSGWCRFFNCEEHHSWLKEHLNDILVDVDGVLKIKKKGEKTFVDVETLRTQHIVCYPSHRGHCLSMVRFTVPRHASVMFWYCKDIQQWLKPALKQGPDRYNEWVRKEFKTWSATFRHAINEPAADSLCDAFIPSRDRFISKQKEIHKQTGAQPVELKGSTF